jgi:hypothetical protein
MMGHCCARGIEGSPLMSFKMRLWKIFGARADRTMRSGGQIAKIIDGNPNLTLYSRLHNGPSSMGDRERTRDFHASQHGIKVRHRSEMEFEPAGRLHARHTAPCPSQGRLADDQINESKRITCCTQRSHAIANHASAGCAPIDWSHDLHGGDGEPAGWAASAGGPAIAGAPARR